MTRKRGGVNNRISGLRSDDAEKNDGSSISWRIFPSLSVMALCLFVGILIGFVFHPSISQVVSAVSEYGRVFLEEPKLKIAENSLKNRPKSKRTQTVFENDGSHLENDFDTETQKYFDMELQKLKEKYRKENLAKNSEEDSEEAEGHRKMSSENKEKVAETQKVDEIFEDDIDITEEEYVKMLRDAGELSDDFQDDRQSYEQEVDDLKNEDNLDRQNTEKGENIKKINKNYQQIRMPDDQKHGIENTPKNQQTLKSKEIERTEDLMESEIEELHLDFGADRSENGRKRPDDSPKNVQTEQITFSQFESQDGWQISGDENVIKLGGRNKRKTIKLNANSKAENSPKHEKLPKDPKSKMGSKNPKPKGAKTDPESMKSSIQPDQTKNKKGTPKATESNKVKVDPKLPDEVRNFKATFLKTITPKKTFIDGRRVPAVELLPQKDTNSSVRVYLFDEFLSEEEADGLIKAHDAHVKQASRHPPLLCFDSINTLRKHLKDSKKKIQVSPNDFTEGTTCVNQTFSVKLKKWLHGNWSYSTAFYPGESRFSSTLATRIQNAMGLTPSHGGKFQLTSYPVGKAYKTHTDCIVNGEDKRDRVASVLIYLNTVSDGGKTEFPDLGVWVKPRKGRALLWNNMNSEGICEEQSRHEASIVKSGQKYILIRWYYYQNFYSLGKRPEEPEIPSREEGQPRVSCDEYNNGSCRWYDEWGYEHLLDYQKQKFTLI